MAQRSHIETEDSQKAVAWLRALLGDRLVAVVLYGSRARGDHRPESDWDLLVIASGLPEDRWERSRIFRVPPRPDIHPNLSLMTKTPEEFDRYLPAVYLDIALDGKVLHDPTGYAAEGLSKLGRIIDKAGLYRERVPGAGFEWRWHDPPPIGKWAIEWDYLDRGEDPGESDAG